MRFHCTNDLPRRSLALAIAAATVFPLAASAASVADSANATPMTGNTMTAEQFSAALARAQAKYAAAQQVADGFAERAKSEDLPDDWHMILVNALMQGTADNFSRVAAAVSTRDAITKAQSAAGSPGAEAATSADSASTAGAHADVSPQVGGLGDGSIDLVYLPLSTPCRIVDTRATGGGGPLAAGQTRNFQVEQVGLQGGSCDGYLVYHGVNGNRPAAIAANITVDARGLTGVVAGSYLQAYLVGGSIPATSWLNFGPNGVVSNGGVLTVGYGTANEPFNIRVSAPANVVIDETGVFLAPNPTPLACTQVGNGANNSNGVGFTVTSPSCASGYTVTGGSCYASAGGLMGTTRLVSSYQNGNAWTCEFYGDTVNNTANATATCCKVRGGPATP